jgi:low affinity Fe/Cu permease
MRDWFSKLARATAEAVGSPGSFVLALGVILVWAITGPLFGFSDTWQLIINTATTVVTFLMVFLIQYAQNRDAKGLHLKIDELIKAAKGARNSLLDLDGLTDDQLADLEKRYRKLAENTGSHRHYRKAKDTTSAANARER